MMYTQTQRPRSWSKQIVYRLQIWSFLLFLPLVFVATIFTAQQVYGQTGNFSCENSDVKLKSEECEALVSFYQTHGGPNWITSTNWLTPNTTPCTWVGVSCEGTDELHITQLVLNGRGLTGTLAMGLANFPMLHTLNVSDNRMNGVIPPSLVNAKELKRLYLQNNQFTGIFPTIPPTKTFTALGLGKISIGGSLSQILTKLPKTLTYLHLRNTNLTGDIPPQISDFSQLEELYLDKNFLSGEIPLALETMSNIKRLDLSYNQLSGEISEIIACNPNIIVNVNGDYLNTPEGYLNLGHNKLRVTGSEAQKCLEGLDPLNEETGSDPDWDKSQTVPPVISASAPITNHSAGFTVDITPITYKEHGGGYEIGCRESAASPAVDYPIQTFNPDKNAITVTAKLLRPGTDYTCAVRTKTEPHSGQQSTLVSEWSAATVTHRPTINLLSLYALAFDSNLHEHREEILQSIQKTTENDPEKVALVLVDGASLVTSTIQTITGTQIITTHHDDTAIYFIYGDQRELIAGKEEMNGPQRSAPAGLPRLETPWDDPQGEDLMNKATRDLITNLSDKLKRGEYVSASLTGTNRLDEYNMANPLQLGAFIKWARTTFEAEQTKTTFTFIGHGIPLAPAGPASNLNSDEWFADGATEGINASSFTNTIFELPSKQDITPGSLTDQRSESLISPYALAEALRIGTDNGNDPLQMLDVVHCFGATIEELYELSNPDGKPFAEVIDGSPNYAYAGPLVVEHGLKVITPEQSAEEMGESIIKAYDDALRIADESDNGVNIVVEHPRVMISIRSSPIITLTLKINILSAILLEQMQEGTSIEASRIVSALEKAHRNSTHYDTTFCSIDNRPQDWQLNPEDALSDLAVFMYKLKAELIDMPDVVKAIDDIHEWLQATVIGTPIRVSGTPYYAENPTPWTFDDPTIDDPEIRRTVGIGLYTDFVGFDITREDATVQNILGWQAYWYSTDTPKQYAFAEGDYTWAHVFTRYWEIKQMDRDKSLELLACNVNTPLIRNIQWIYLPSVRNR